ncbi:DUF6069 family protein [Streptomyces sp. NBC_01304]|uniref:DUF6069 family protein n=1 Tax=Streptomyces sp. NBC_01304 TaxID=2903818 RepID=UPI002E0DDA50|nr:DUF6069 family protein [Streptomyces sp. NBC_01304]
MGTETSTAAAATAVGAGTPTARRGRDRALAVGSAVAATALVWAVGRAAGAELVVPQGAGKDPMDVGIGAVLATTLGISLLGWGALALLERRLPGRALAIWTRTAAVVTLLSLLPALASQAEAGTKVVLSLLHLTVAAVLVPLVRRTAKS